MSALLTLALAHTALAHTALAHTALAHAAAPRVPVPRQFIGTWTEARVSCSASDEVAELTIEQDGLYTEAVEAEIRQVRVIDPNRIEVDTRVTFEPPQLGTSLLVLSDGGRRMTIRVIRTAGKPVTEPAMAYKRCPGQQ